LYDLGLGGEKRVMAKALITEPVAATRPTLPGTVVIGLGNPLRGDDGVGVRVVQALAKQPLPSGVEVVDGGTQGLGLVTLLEGRQRVIFVDAAQASREPGQFVRFTLDEANLLGDNPSMAIHEAGLRDVLILAEALKMLPSQVVIFGVEPASIEWDHALSDQVEACLPSLVKAVLEEIEIQPSAARS
jgi:hydrogenase maturation protease